VSAPAGDLVLVRHAPTKLQAEVRSAEWELAPGARELSVELAGLLAGLRLQAPGSPPSAELPIGPIDLVVTSHEPKAVGTGRLLAKELGVRAVTASGLEEHHRERLEILPQVAWNRTLKRFFANPEVLLFGKETGAEARARFLAAVRALLDERPGQRLAVVSHATVMTLLLAEPNGLDPFQLWRSVKMPEAFVVDAATFRIGARLAPAGAT